MPKKSIWTDTTSKYGTYKGARGNPAQWSATFDQVFTQSDTIQSIIGMSAFTVLGIEPTASDEIVKRAYRRLVKIHRADREGDDSTQFRKIQNAYDSIMDKRHPRIELPKEVEDDDDTSIIPTDTLVTPQLLTEIDEHELQQYLNDPDFCAQEKKDGKHLTLQILNNKLIVRNRKGISCGCAPEFEPSIRQCNSDLLIDGEQVNGTFWTWDILELNGINLRNLPYRLRHEKLSNLSFGPNIKILNYAATKEEKQTLYNYLWSSCKEGIVFKRLSATYSSGKNNDALKFKFYAECSVIIVAGRPNKASIGMELFNNNGEREFVGYCSCNRRPPIGSIAEIKYLYAYRGGCLYQPAFKELRDDVNISECTTSQLKYKSEED